MSDVSLDDEHVYCTRCGQSITESYACLGACECGKREWEFQPPNPFPLAGEVPLTHD